MRISTASDRRRAPIRGISEKPKFHTKMIKNGRWTVAVTPGYGPASYVGDFATEEEASVGFRPSQKTGRIQIPNNRHWSGSSRDYSRTTPQR